MAPLTTAPMEAAHEEKAGLIDDIALFALAQHVCLLATIVLAKAASLAHTFPKDHLALNLGRLPVVLSDDLLILAAAALPIAIGSHFPWRRFGALRVMAAAILYLIFAAWIALSLANAGFLATVGTALDPDLLSLAPRLGRYFVNTATRDTLWMAAAGLAVCLVPLAATPFLVRMGRGRTRLLSALLVAALGGFGLLFSRAVPGNSEERTLRNMTVAHALFASPDPALREATPPNSRQLAIIDGLQGGTKNDGRVAFASLPRKHYNVLYVVWESVGERYLRLHPLGNAATPNLEAGMRLGSVRFRQAYAQCPLSVESVWTFFTGRKPPGKASIFLEPGVMPPHGPTLPEVLKAQGYDTSVLIGSYTRSWGADRIVKLGGVDVFEDIETLANRDRFEQLGWSIDGRAISDRFWSWLDDRPGKPFFSVLWNVETHYPYRWAAMSPEDDVQGDDERYKRVIEHADRLLGDIVAGLRKRGLEQDTLIVVAGDHGEGMGRPPHPNQRLHGGTVFEDSMQVPLVFLHPRLGEARVVDSPATLADVYPTVLGLLGIAAPPDLDGVSWTEPVAPRSIIMHAMQWWPIAIRSGAHKLMLLGPNAPAELFQVEQDPLEAVDLSGQNPEIALALRSRLLFETATRTNVDVSMKEEWRMPWIPEKMRSQVLGPGARRGKEPQPTPAPGKP